MASGCSGTGTSATRTLTAQELRWVGFGANLNLDNYQGVLSGGTVKYRDANGDTITRLGNNFSDAVMNSVAVAIPSTLIPILIAAFAAYAFAWMEFPGRKSLFVLVVALLVVPLQIALIPVLRDFTKLKLNGTFLAMWLAHTGFGLPLAVYLLFNYISQLPRDIFESAFLDGATPFNVFVRLVIPLSVPALASFAIFQFLWVWNDYLVALIFLGRQEPGRHQRPGRDGRGKGPGLALPDLGSIPQHDPAAGRVLRAAALLRTRADRGLGEGIVILK